MTDDIFSRIVQRARGELPLARPLIAPLYAPGAAFPSLADSSLLLTASPADTLTIEQISETRSATVSVPRPAVQARPVESVDPPPAVLILKHGRDLVQHTEGWPLESRIAREAGVAAAERVMSDPPDTRRHARPPVPPVESDGPGSLNSAIASPPDMVQPNIAPLVPLPQRREHASSEAPEPRRGILADVRLRHAHVPPPDTREGGPASTAVRPVETSPVPPQIRISIGRVEVRAVAAPVAAGPPPERPRPSGPQLSLDDYLRARNEGRQ